MEATITEDGKLSLPAELQRDDDFRSGATFHVERVGAGDYRLKRVPQALKPAEIVESPDGYLVFKGEGVITREMVRRLEARLV